MPLPCFAVRVELMDAVVPVFAVGVGAKDVE